MDALFLLWRSLISRSAASRAAARTSVFSERFFWITSSDAPTRERLDVFTLRFLRRAVSVVWSCDEREGGRGRVGETSFAIGSRSVRGWVEPRADGRPAARRKMMHHPLNETRAARRAGASLVSRDGGKTDPGRGVRGGRRALIRRGARS